MRSSKKFLFIRNLIHFNGKRITFKGQDYIASQDISWKIAAYLMKKNLDQKPDLSLIKTAHENINIISNRYGEQKPFIVQIKPGVTKEPPKPCLQFIYRAALQKGPKQQEIFTFQCRNYTPYIRMSKQLTTITKLSGKKNGKIKRPHGLLLTINLGNPGKKHRNHRRTGYVRRGFRCFF